MLGHRFSTYITPKDDRTPFEKLLPLFLELLTHTSGDVEEALDWMDELDKEHGFYTREYGRKEFEADLRKKGIIGDPPTKGGRVTLTGKAEQLIRQRALDQVFGKLKKSDRGQHGLRRVGEGDEPTGDRRGYRYGDRLEQIAMSDSIRNAQQHGVDDLRLSEGDLEVMETEHQSACATVLMIDISHSMILYGEDRITPAKKVAIALTELIKQKYPKDSVEVITFGNEAQQVPAHRLPYLQVGPFHTNTQAGLRLAQRLLSRQKHTNKQIFMVTDGKPTVIHEQGQLYRNVSWILDPLIVNRTLEEAELCRRRGITISTFMIAQDPHLVEFVDKLTQVNRGRAYFSALDKLGGNIFVDYMKN
ncbi:MAG: VWA domain-containing protein, partial [Flavobacteriales bacterium]|nr:VWA domain-containing protein [Flavobacteriales bacterium]